MGLLDWLTSAERTQQMQGFGNNLKGAIEQLKQQRGLLDTASRDTITSMKRGGSIFPDTPAQRQLNQSIASGVVNSIGPLMTKGVGKFVYPQEQALLTAQKNAALPIEKGGLGLPANNTPMDRARAMGFDTDAFHATPADFQEFKISPYRGSSFLAPSGKGASSGASAGAGDAYGRQGADKIMPVAVRSEDIRGLSLTGKEKQWLDSIPAQIKESQVDDFMKGKPAGTAWFNWLEESQLPNGEFVYTKKAADRIPYSQAISTNRDVYGHQPGNYATASDERWASNNANNLGKKGFLQNDEGGLSIAITQPNAIRSRFAAFDPLRRHEADLLAGAIPFSVMVDQKENLGLGR